MDVTLNSIFLVAATLVLAGGILAGLTDRYGNGMQKMMSATVMAAFIAMPMFFTKLVDGWTKGLAEFLGGEAGVSPISPVNPSSTTTASPSPTSTATPTPSPSSTTTPADSVKASETWSMIWPWLLGALVLVLVIALGVWLFAHALAKRAEIAAAAKERREQRARAAEIRAQVTKDWNAALTRHDALNERWAEPDHNLTLLLSMPAIRDLTVPTTRTALEALLDADSLRAPYAPDGVTNAKTTQYVRAVNTADAALRDAFRFAKRDALNAMSSDERRKLNQAQKLLATAQNAAATPAERQLAYERVRVLMDELQIEVPPRVMEAIETQTRKLIEMAHA